MILLQVSYMCSKGIATYFAKPFNILMYLFINWLLQIYRSITLWYHLFLHCLLGLKNYFYCLTFNRSIESVCKEVFAKSGCMLQNKVMKLQTICFRLVVFTLVMLIYSIISIFLLLLLLIFNEYISIIISAFFLMNLFYFFPDINHFYPKLKKTVANKMIVIKPSKYSITKRLNTNNCLYYWD